MTFAFEKSCETGMAFGSLCFHFLYKDAKQREKVPRVRNRFHEAESAYAQSSTPVKDQIRTPLVEGTLIVDIDVSLCSFTPSPFALT